MGNRKVRITVTKLSALDSLGSDESVYNTSKIRDVRSVCGLENAEMEGKPNQDTHLSSSVNPFVGSSSSLQ
jgi:hypothetical protein